MRKVIFGINMSLDGCCDHTKFGGSIETMEYFRQLLEGVGVIVYGRKTYELMVPYWPEIARNPTDETKEEIAFARTFNSIPKVVFSRTLKNVNDENSRLATNNLKDEILKLKQEPGKNISIGGVALPSQLMELGLVDEYYFLVHPVLVGPGARLFDTVNLAEKLQLKLADSRVMESGCIALHYLKK